METLARNWWALVLRGVAGVIFGVLTFLFPAMTLAALILLFGTYAVVDGIFNIIAAAAGRPGQPWWQLVLEGIVSIAAGVIAFAWPGLTALVLLWIIAGWAIVTGVLEIVAAIRLRNHIANEWWLALSGGASAAFGVLLLVAPVAGALAVTLWIGAYAVVFGALLIGLGIRLRRHRQAELHRMPRAA
jgi:uncharacterized membrane protein HdeD (DUF308 family)